MASSSPLELTAISAVEKTPSRDHLNSPSIATTEPPHVYPPSSTHLEREMPPLPPVDRGRAAYLFLLSAFMAETVVWGVSNSYGVFLAYYSAHGVGGGNKAGSELLPLVGSFASGLMYLMGPPIALLLNPRPRWRVPATRVGSLICVLALLSSSFANTSWQLLLTQGLLYSIGGSLVYYPTFSFISEWFVDRRGFAQGVCFAGTAIGGVFYPFILDALLSKYGPRITLQALAVTTFLLLSASMPLLRARIPVGRSYHSADNTHHQNPSPVERRKVYRSKRLWIFMFANVFQALGWFLPAYYLPSFAASIGLSATEGSAMLACVNGTSVISRVGVGILSDRVSPHKIGAFTMAASSISVLLLWGVTSTSLAPLLVFSLVLGLVAGG